MKVYKIVLTGGPCSGKTEILKKVFQTLKELGYSVFICPETARPFIESGIKPKDDYEYTMIFQDAILKQQYFREHITEKFANMESKNNKTIILYDRAVIDNRAYLNSQKDFKKILSDNNLTETEIIDKYDLVINLVSLAALDSSNYINDDARTESKELAKLIDAKTTNAWVLHNNLKIVLPTEELDDKVEIVMSHITDLINQKRETIEETHTITKEQKKNLVNNLDEDNSKTRKITIYNLYTLSIRCRTYQLVKTGYDGQITYRLDMFDEYKDKKIHFETEKLAEEQFLYLLNKHRVYKTVEKTEIIFVKDFEINRINTYDDIVELTVEKNRNVESLIKDREKTFVKKWDIW